MANGSIDAPNTVTTPPFLGASTASSAQANTGNNTHKSGTHTLAAHKRVLDARIQGALNGSARPKAQIVAQAQPQPLQQLAYFGHTDGADKGGSKPSLGFMA